MDFSWLAEPHTWIGFATLLVLEVVLGIDNLVFVAILANKVKPSQRDRARITGLGLAVVIRIFMLGFMAHIMTLTRPLFELGGLEISGKDMIMFAGGISYFIKRLPSCTNDLRATINLRLLKDRRSILPFGALWRKS